MLVCGIKRSILYEPAMANKRGHTYAIRGIVIIYFIILLTLILLAASNYPVQWRVEANRERSRYLEVIVQAIEYYKLDHDGALFDLPAEHQIISNQEGCSYECPALGRVLSCYNLQAKLVPGYVRGIPSDPLLVRTPNSGFYLSYRGAALTLGACHKFFRDPVEIQKKL